MGDMHSQLDGLLSQASTHIDVLRHMMMATTWQDSTYQGDRFNGHMGSQQHSQYLSQFSQVCLQKAQLVSSENSAVSDHILCMPLLYRHILQQ